MNTNSSWKKYLFWFATEHVDFRIAEIQSIFKIWNFGPKIIDQIDASNESLNKPFWIVDLPNDEFAKQIASRAVSLKCIIELWTHSNTYEKFHQSLKACLDINKKQQEHLFAKDKTFRVTVETYNRHYTQKEKVEKIEQNLGYLPSQGNVDLKNPDINFWYIEFFGMDPNNVPVNPLDILFGKWLVDGQRRMLHDISLKTRKFIGNTSMDPQLSILMANQGLVQKGDFVFDPFVGSGSLLVPAAKFGAYVMGTDINYQMLHGKSKPTRVSQTVRATDESILANLKQYNCSGLYIDVLVSDFSLPTWTDSLKFDSIITDPPYGIREAMEKVKAKSSRKATVLAEDSVHYPSTSPYKLNHLFADLLQFAAKHLKMNGRLVFWFPIYLEDYSDESLPSHPCLKLIANSENPLSSFTSRRLLTFEKISEANELMEKESNGTNYSENFRDKYFSHQEETRAIRRAINAQVRENGRLEALKRGKILKDK